MLLKVRRATNVPTICEKLESFVETCHKDCSMFLYMTNSYYHLRYFIGKFQLLQSNVFVLFGSWINLILKAAGVHIWYNGNLFPILLFVFIYVFRYISINSRGIQKTLFLLALLQRMELYFCLIKYPCNPVSVDVVLSLSLIYVTIVINFTSGHYNTLRGYSLIS